MDMYGRVYGIEAWERWEKEKPKPQDLSPQKRRPQDIDASWTRDVSTFRELFRIVAFLNVMNKTTNLLFRGQTKDLDPIPTLIRDCWPVPSMGRSVDLRLDREHYWRELAPLCDVVKRKLDGKLPRHAPFDQFQHRGGWQTRLRMAPWAVIQHYELWPTPLLDLTSSLRVGASFALGVDSHEDAPVVDKATSVSAEDAAAEGYLWVYDAQATVSDLMSLGRSERDSSEAGCRSRQGVGPVIPEPVTCRLSAVCPPQMDRPHLQEGYLLGNSTFGPENLRDSYSYLKDRLVAKFHLTDQPRNGTSTFWSKDFPKHETTSLLPEASDDEIKGLLDGVITYEIADEKAYWRAPQTDAAV